MNQLNPDRIIEFPANPSFFVRNRAKIFSPRFATPLDPDTLTTALNATVEQLERAATERNLTAVFVSGEGALLDELSQTEAGQAYYRLRDQLEAAEWREVAEPWIRRGLFISFGIGAGYVGYRLAEKRGWTTGLTNRARRIGSRLTGWLPRRRRSKREITIMENLLIASVTGKQPIALMIELGQDDVDGFGGIVSFLATPKRVLEGQYRFEGVAGENSPVVKIAFPYIALVRTSSEFSPDTEQTGFTIMDKAKITLMVEADEDGAPQAYGGTIWFYKPPKHNDIPDGCYLFEGKLAADEDLPVVRIAIPYTAIVDMSVEQSEELGDEYPTFTVKEAAIRMDPAAEAPAPKSSSSKTEKQAKKA
jgi:hypothetical protein